MASKVEPLLTFASKGVVILSTPLLALGYFFCMGVYRFVLEGPSYVKPPPHKGWKKHEEDVEKVLRAFNGFLDERRPDENVVLMRSKGGEADSNRTTCSLYKQEARKVDVSHLDSIIEIDKEKMLVHIEPGVPMDEMARVTIAHHVVPPVVLEFPGITVGGALSGGAIESSSNQFGSFFDTVQEVDVITGDGVFHRGVSRTHLPDLFYGLTASYGTNGIVTRIALKLEHASKYIHVRYLHCNSLDLALRAMSDVSQHVKTERDKLHAAAKDLSASSSAQPPALPSFVDGVLLTTRSTVAVFGTPTDAPPPNVPYRSLRNNRWDKWFFWLLTDISRQHPALTPEQAPPSPFEQPKEDPSKMKLVAETRDALDWLKLTSNHGCEEYMTLEDYLFRFDRGAFWMARHGLGFFYHELSYNTEEDAERGYVRSKLWNAIFLTTSYIFSVKGLKIFEQLFPALRSWLPAQHRTPFIAFTSLLGVFIAHKIALHACGPILHIRLKYAWKCTTRQLYRILHQLDDDFLARIYSLQDFVMPSPARAVEFVEFLEGPASNHIDITPLWICPVRMIDHRHPSDAGFGFPVQETKKDELMVNVGVYGPPYHGQLFDPYEFNHSMEAKVSALGGRKMLYAQSFYSEAEFWSLFNKEAYEACRAKYGGVSVFPPITKKLLLGEKRLAKMHGIKPINLLGIGSAMWVWYATIWGEIFLPRFLHPYVGITDAALISYLPVDD